MIYPAKTNPETIKAEAIALIDSEGEKALTARRLSNRLGLAPNALYRHFRSKESLEEAIADEIARRLHDDIGAALAAAESLGAADRVRTLVTAYSAFADEHPNLYEMVMTGRDQSPDPLPTLRGHELLWEQVIDVLTPLIGAADAPAAAVTLWAWTHGLRALRRANLLGGKKPADVAAYGLEAFLAGLIRDPQGRV